MASVRGSSSCSCSCSSVLASLSPVSSSDSVSVVVSFIVASAEFGSSGVVIRCSSCLGR